MVPLPASLANDGDGLDACSVIVRERLLEQPYGAPEQNSETGTNPVSRVTSTTMTRMNAIGTTSRMITIIAVNAVVVILSMMIAVAMIVDPVSAAATPMKSAADDHRHVNVGCIRTRSRKPGPR